LVANSQPNFQWPPNSCLDGCIGPLAYPWLCNDRSLAWLRGNARIGCFRGARLSQVVSTQHCISNHSLLSPLTSFPHVQAAPTARRRTPVAGGATPHGRGGGAPLRAAGAAAHSRATRQLRPPVARGGSPTRLGSSPRAAVVPSLSTPCSFSALALSAGGRCS